MMLLHPANGSNMKKTAFFFSVLLLFQLSLAQAQEKEAVFAGGCFWCMEEAFEKLGGVLLVVSGFGGGHQTDPSYRDVVAGGTGHYEVIRVVYDDEKISYEKLLEAFWHNIDPTDDGGQFCDRGSSYRTAIFYLNEEQKNKAEKSLAQLRNSNALNQPIATPILAAGTFYPAEKAHQDYYKTSPIRYKYYKYACGRPQRLKELWGEKSAEPEQVKPLY